MPRRNTEVTRMNTESKSGTMRTIVIVLGIIVVLLVLWIPFSIGRVVTGNAPWGPKIGGKLPNGIEVYFQSRPAGLETDDRLIVVAPNMAPKHYWVDRVHGGFEHVVLKYNNTGNQLWVESDGRVAPPLIWRPVISALSTTRNTIGRRTGPAQRSTQGIQALLLPFSARGS